ncbi:MAG: DegT/DnrJ/EryC1/StrS family aminotransferase [Candidatus Acidiferrum sp.]
MNATLNSFLVPREQWLAWKYLSITPRPSPQEGGNAQNGPHFFFWARNAIYHALEALEVPRHSRALLPAYLCRAAAEPFAAYGLECDFYDLKRDCTPDFSVIDAKIRPETRVVLTAHYFGFPQKIEEFSDLCRRRNLLLFEDCAHVLRTEFRGKRLGTFGDASVFSYRKFLPMFDGAELLLSKAEKGAWKLESSRFGRQASRFIGSLAVNNSSSLFAKVIRRGVETTKGNGGTNSAESAATAPVQQAVDNNSTTFDPTLLNQPMSGPSRWVLRHSDVEAVIERRRANFVFLQEKFRNATGITPLFEELPIGVCPWVYPMFIDGIPNAHLLLREAGVPAVTWGGVRIENIRMVDFPGADFLYDNLIFLPVHQNLTDGHLGLIADAVKKAGVETRSLEPQKIFLPVKRDAMNRKAERKSKRAWRRKTS